MGTIAVSTINESSNIAGFAYDTTDKVMVVQFHKEGSVIAVYIYRDVPPVIVQRWVNVVLAKESVGGFFAKEVKPKYKGIKE